MAKTEVILIENVPNLGGESDQVKVAMGYARNYLIPQGLAIPLTQANKRRLEVLKERRSKRESHELQSMMELSKSLEKLVLTITVKTGDDGKLFGSVTSANIADELKQQFDVSVDRKKIMLETPIRTLGDHEVPLHLHRDVDGVLKVRVQSSTPLPETTAEVGESAAPAEGSPSGRGRSRREGGAGRGRAKKGE